jgi:hypothetical protein
MAYLSDKQIDECMKAMYKKIQDEGRIMGIPHYDEIKSCIRSAQTIDGFNIPETRIITPKDALLQDVKIRVFDYYGKEIKEVISANLESGECEHYVKDKHGYFVMDLNGDMLITNQIYKTPLQLVFIRRDSK